MPLSRIGENVIYRVDLPNGSIQGDQTGSYLPDRTLLRLHAWDNVAYINSETLWLKALAGEGGLAVPGAIRALNGDFVKIFGKIDFADCEEISQAMGTKVTYAHPYAFWQRGTRISTLSSGKPSLKTKS